MFGVKVRDINFAFKLCRRRIFEHVELKSEGSFIDAELIIRSTRMGYEIMQMGVDYFPRTRGVSTLSSPGRDLQDPAGDVVAAQATSHEIQKVRCIQNGADDASANCRKPVGRPGILLLAFRRSPSVIFRSVP